MTDDPFPRESIAARLKVLLRTPGVEVLDATRLRVAGSPELQADVLRKARAGAAILGRSLGWVTGRELVLTLIPVESHAVSMVPAPGAAEG